MLHFYDVFHHPEKGYEAVKHGFSWPAMCFSLIWASCKKLHLIAVLLALVIITNLFLIHAIEESAGPSEAELYAAVSRTMLLMICGHFGNGWRRWSLERSGYQHIGFFTAETPDGALAQMMRERERAAAQQTAPDPLSLDKHFA